MEVGVGVNVALAVALGVKVAVAVGVAAQGVNDAVAVAVGVGADNPHFVAKLASSVLRSASESAELYPMSSAMSPFR